MGTASIDPSAGAEAAEAEEETIAMAEEEGPEEEEASDRVEAAAAAADSEEAEVRIFEGKKLDYGNVRSKMNVCVWSLICRNNL